MKKLGNPILRWGIESLFALVIQYKKQNGPKTQ